MTRLLRKSIPSGATEYLLCLIAILLPACNRTTEINGEAFWVQGTNIVRQAGLRVFFLPESEGANLKKIEDDAEQAFEKASRAQLQDFTNRFLITSGYEERAKEWALASIPEVRDGSKSAANAIFVLGDNSKLPDVPDVKAFYAFLIMPPIERRGAKEIEKILQNAQSVLCDTEGKFSIRLPPQKWVVYSVSPKQKWHFTFAPAGQKLVLSNGNAEQ